MTKGKVKWYNKIKGFGFIEGEDGKDIFVHKTNLLTRNKVLEEDQQVVFEIRQGEKGPVATNVKLVDKTD